LQVILQAASSLIMIRMAQLEFRADRRLARVCKRLPWAVWVSACAALLSVSLVSAADPPPRHVQRAAPRPSLEGRVQVLSKALKLDPQQQAELRRALLEQREQVLRVWNDESLPAANRVRATQAISEQTADRVRALLNEQQRKLYNAPRPQGGTHAAGESRSVEEWMSATAAPPAAPGPDTAPGNESTGNASSNGKASHGTDESPTNAPPPR
jgi:hypothetical protein